MKDSTTSPNRKRRQGVAALAFWLAVWQLCSAAVGKELLLPSPLRAGSRLIALLGDGLFWRSILATGGRVLLGFAAALLVGAALAALAARFSAVRVLFGPLLGAVRATPVASFIMLVLIWMHTGRVPVFVAFLMVVPLVWTNLYAGIGALDRDQLEMARLFRFSRARTARFVVLPALMPHIVSACSSGLGFAWKSAIAAEVIAQPALSIGKQIQTAKVYLLTTDLFAWTIAVVALSVALEKSALAGLRRLERRMLRYNSAAADTVREGRM